MVTILQAGILPDASAAALKKRFNVYQLPLDPFEQAQFLSLHANEIEGIAVRGRVIDESLLKHLPQLKVISSFSAGLDNIAQSYCAMHGIKMYSTSAILADDVADLALTLALVLTRQVLQGHQLVISGLWATQQFPLTQSFSSLNIGIIGLGHIGLALAKRCAVMGSTVAYYGRSAKQVPYLYFSNIDEIATWCDLLFICCPLTDETQGLINQDVLTRLKDGFLVNVARGAIVDEQALMNALTNNELKGVGLDVYSHEPNVPTALMHHPRVVLSPHAASGTIQTREKMGAHVVSTLAQFFSLLDK